MKKTVLGIVAALAVSVSGAAFAQQYNKVPVGDKQYADCLVYSVSKYTGGQDASPIAGQSKAEAWCTCMWNETSDDFRGDLAKFGETSKGAAINKICEKYSGWE